MESEEYFQRKKSEVAFTIHVKKELSKISYKIVRL